MKLYIAASSHPDERDRVDAAFEAAQAIDGVEVIGDWRPSVDTHGRNPTENANECAANCIGAIEKADAVWLLIPMNESRGAWFEFGYAEALGKLVFGSGAKPSQSVFTSWLDRAFVSDPVAVRFLEDGAEEALEIHRGEGGLLGPAVSHV